LGGVGFEEGEEGASGGDEGGASIVFKGVGLLGEGVFEDTEEGEGEDEEGDDVFKEGDAALFKHGGFLVELLSGGDLEGVVLEESFWVGYLDVDDVGGIWGGDEGFGGGGV